MEEEKKKKFMGIGVLALIASVIGGILAVTTVLGFKKYGIFGLSMDKIYTVLGFSVAAIALGKIVELLEHSDEKAGSIAIVISKLSLAAIAVIYIIILTH